MEVTKVKELIQNLRKRLLDSRFLSPITSQQLQTQKAAKLPFPAWISQVHLPIPVDEQIGQSLYDAIRSLADGSETIHRVQTSSVNAEWVGFRHSTEPSDSKMTSQAEQYGQMMNDVSSDVVLIYAHGGAFLVGSPAASRRTTARLAKMTGGRCLAVQYRLSPQNPFPAGLLDLFVAYLSLLYPLPGSRYEPVPATSIVLTGESAGANLCLTLLQVILSLSRIQKTPTPKIRWNGRMVPLPLPAGVATLSAWADLARALPSWRSDDVEDLYGGGAPLWTQAHFPACAAWPTNPPRGDPYCEISALCHPLVSPTAAADWTGAPPMLFLCGEERAADSNKVLAQQAQSQGVQVVWQQYEAMPHISPILLEKLPQSARFMEQWAKFCRQCVESGESIRASGTFIEAKTLHFRAVDTANLTKLSVQDARAMMHRQKATRSVWTGPTATKSVL